MKNQIKGFSKFINENLFQDSDSEMEKRPRHSSRDGAGNGIAVWNIFDYNSVVRFGDNEIVIDSDEYEYDEDGNFGGIDRVFDAAAELGASSEMIWSSEDSQLIFRR
jgi:hypothetical protein